MPIVAFEGGKDFTIPPGYMAQVCGSILPTAASHIALITDYVWRSASVTATLRRSCTMLGSSCSSAIAGRLTSKPLSPLHSPQWEDYTAARFRLAVLPEGDHYFVSTHYREVGGRSG